MREGAHGERSNEKSRGPKRPRDRRMKINARSLLTFVAFAGALGFSATAQAEEKKNEVYLELGFNTRSPSGTSLTTWAPNLGFFTHINESIALSADWGLTALDIEDGVDAPGVKPLNPFVALHLTPTIGDLDLRAGLGIALPVAEANDAANLAPYASARALRGSWDPWLYEPDTVSFVLPLRAEFNGLDMLMLAAEGAVYLQLDTAGGQERLGFQGAIEAALRLGRAQVGLRLQGVRPEDEVVRGSVEPFVSLGLGPVALRGRLTMNLSEPDGFAFDPDGIWGAHFGVAYEF